ncbi:MAG: glycoside hydrolase family 10 protein [Chitinophagaceae bacterium]
MKKTSNAFAIFILLSTLFACSKTDGGTTTNNNTNNNNNNTNTTNPTTPITPVWDANAWRGVWVTTTASTALDSKDNITQTVANCKKAGINQIFIVVYNNARTIYPSNTLGAITGVKQLEKFAGRDPLQEMIDIAHAAGIKVHAWFEYGFSSSYSVNGGAIIKAKPEWAALDQSGKLVVKNGFDWLNAFLPEVQDFIVNLVLEVVSKYDVDGIQGDDRLPALPSTAGYDAYTVAQYKAEHNNQSPPSDYKDQAWVKWRANRLNKFMKRLHTEVKGAKPNMIISSSPSPYPWSLAEYLQDWPTWVDSSWVDAVIPQCYRYDIIAYESVLSEQVGYHRNKKIAFYPGVLVKIGTKLATPEFMTEMVSANRKQSASGEVFFFYEGLKDNLNWFETKYPLIK